MDDKRNVIELQKRQVKSKLSKGKGRREKKTGKRKMVNGKNKRK